MTREAFYDDVVAPKLLELSRLCQAKGLSFLAVCEWSPNEYGRTLALEPGAGIGIRMADAMARSRGNLDTFLMAMSRHAQRHGHQSAYLEMLGIPSGGGS